MLCELYARRAKDLWNTPETIALLSEAAGSDITPAPRSVVPGNTHVDEALARHVLLLEDPALIALLPASYTRRYGSPYDPLPPNNPVHQGSEDSDNETVSESGEGRRPRAFANEDVAQIPPTEDEPSWVRNILNLIRGWNDPGATELLAEAQISQEYVEQLAQSRREVLEVFSDTDSSRENRHQPTVEEEGDLPEWVLGAGAPPLQEEGPLLETPEEADQRNQRYLAGRGMQALRDFIVLNGVDDSNWGPDVDRSALTEYTRRVMMLRKKATRNFILDYVLRQGTSTAVRDLVVKEVGRLEREGVRPS